MARQRTTHDRPRSRHKQLRSTATSTSASTSAVRPTSVQSKCVLDMHGKSAQGRLRRGTSSRALPAPKPPPCYDAQSTFGPRVRLPSSASARWCALEHRRCELANTLRVVVLIGSCRACHTALLPVACLSNHAPAGCRNCASFLGALEPSHSPDFVRAACFANSLALEAGATSCDAAAARLVGCAEATAAAAP